VWGTNSELTEFESNRDDPSTKLRAGPQKPTFEYVGGMKRAIPPAAIHEDTLKSQLWQHGYKDGA